MCCVLIWGTFLILFGLSIIASVLFGISIPIVRIFLGLLLLYIGVQVISGNSKKRAWHCGARCHRTSRECNTCCGTCNIHVDERALNADSMPLEYSTVFGSARIDLSDLTVELLKKQGVTTVISINTIFGKTELKLNKQVPVRIIGKSAFSKTSFPDNTMITFGTHTYLSHDPAEIPLVLIQANTVFGALEIETNE